MQDPSSMAEPELIREILSLRGALRDTGKRIFELSRVLQTKVRRADSNEYSARYLAFTNASIRFVGGLEQSITRTASFDKMVASIPKEQAEAEKKQQDSEQRQRRPKIPVGDGMSDLVTLFGQEMVDAAL